MSPVLVALCYGSATIFSLFLLWYFGVRSTWWHALSVALACIVGLFPLPAFLDNQAVTLAVGWVFVCLLFWGIAAPLFSTAHRSVHGMDAAGKLHHR